MEFIRLIYFLNVAPDIPMQSVLTSSTNEAEQIHRVTNYFFWAAGGMLLIVAALTAAMLYKFNHKKNNATAKSLNKKWEFLMIGVPSVLICIFFFLSATTLSNIHGNTENKNPDVVITAHQWWWQAHYPNENVTTANEIHLPAGKKVLLKLLAADVVHDWWIPQFGSKMDMVPTQDNYLWLTIKQPGEYYGVCSEFCGAQHTNMRIKVVAQSNEDFQQWLMAQQKLNESNNNPAANLFVAKTCGNCHTIDGLQGANGITGPNLTHIGSRKTLLAGVLDNSEENLERWIDHPQKIKPGANMPDFLLDENEVKALAAYLYSLK